jgi:sugar phosphate isomerase/epimerase
MTKTNTNMLKYAFMSFSTPEMPLDAMLAHAAKLGYDGVEPRLGHAHGIGPEATTGDRKRIRQILEKSEVNLCCIASQGNLTDPAKRDETVDLNRCLIELAGDLACPRIRIFGGKLPEGMTREQAVEEVAEVLRGLTEEARQAGVTLCMETHDGWCDPEHVATLMKRVDHPSLGVNWDMMHPTRVVDVPVEQGYATLRPWIRHVHIHDAVCPDPLAFRPCGEGDYDIRSALQCLVRDGYTGYVSGEWINAGGIIDLADELKRLKVLEAEVRNVEGG